MFGFTFNGTTSQSFGLSVLTKRSPILPDVKRVTEDLPGVHGVMDFSAAYPDNKVKYEPINISIECGFYEKDLYKYREKLHNIAFWLSYTNGNLIFDDNPNIIYKARIKSVVQASRESQRVGRFTVDFVCVSSQFN